MSEYICRIKRYNFFCHFVGMIRSKVILANSFVVRFEQILGEVSETSHQAREAILRPTRVHLKFGLV